MTGIYLPYKRTARLVPLCRQLQCETDIRTARLVPLCRQLQCETDIRTVGIINKYMPALCLFPLPKKLNVQWLLHVILRIVTRNSALLPQGISTRICLM